MDTTSWQTPGSPCTATSMPRHPKASRTLMGVNTVLAIHAGTPLSSEAVNSQSAHNISIRRLGNIPGAQHLAVASSPHSHGKPPCTPSPHLVLGAKTRPRSRPRKSRETFPRAASTPRKPQGHLCFAFTPCTTAFPQAPSAPQGAPKGRTPTRGGRQPWERASTRNRTRQSVRT